MLVLLVSLGFLSILTHPLEKTFALVQILFLQFIPQLIKATLKKILSF